MINSGFEIYNEFEPFRESMRDIDSQYWINNLRKKEWGIRHIDIGNIHIQYGIEGSGAIVDGSVRTDGWVYYFQTKGSRVRVNGKVMQYGVAYIISPGDMLIISAEDPHNWCSLFVPNAVLFDSTERAMRMSEIGAESRLIRLTHEQVQCIESFEAELIGNRFRVSDDFYDRLVDAARNLLIVPIEHRRRLGRRPGNRVEVLSQAISYIEKSQYMNPKVEDLTKACGVAERTLFNAFQEYYGVSPKDFVLLRRLHACRQLLRGNATEETTVTSVASSFGFWDFGRFAGRYRAAFGELPSETLLRSPS